MENVYIRQMDLPSWIADEYFYAKDIVSIDDLLGVIDNLKDDLEYWKEKYDDYVEYVKDNYRFIDTKEAVGYDEKTW